MGNGSLRGFGNNRSLNIKYCLLAINKADRYQEKNKFVKHFLFFLKAERVNEKKSLFCR
ncbi:Uncharacterized protein dnm_057610 [Desulfonema magnum]|uniref:Uncharacterized protein n=1 Tax=Desulfonema magnum TaxID=45655 RepID=A0A975BPY4_9BACT|nr:Uncharacterized protein dnm_057610 [Desulfonema magnum]